jgi:hypothetical protein
MVPNRMDMGSAGNDVLFMVSNNIVIERPYIYIHHLVHIHIIVFFSSHIVRIAVMYKHRVIESATEALPTKTL